MTETMTRDKAEAAARKGAKVVHATWPQDEWVTFIGADLTDCDGYVYSHKWPWGWDDGWSIIPETAPTPEPTLADLAAQVAELRAAFDMHVHPIAGDDVEMTDTARWSILGEPAPDFTTSRKPPEPAEAVMGDDEIVAAAMECSVYVGFPTKAYLTEIAPPIREAIRLTRASIRAQLKANEAGARLAARNWYDCNGNPTEGYEKAIVAALKAHGEGV